MQVFKVYFLVIKKNLPQIFIYLGIFILLAVMLSSLNKASPVDSFSQTKLKIAVFNYDISLDRFQGFKQYLAKNAEIVEIPDETEAIQDALFFRNVDYIVKIPADFWVRLHSFGLAGPIKIEKISVPGSTTAIYMDMLINKYFNTVRTYIKFSPSLPYAEIEKKVGADLSVVTPVTLKSFNTYSGNTQSPVYYFNYLAYSLFAILILGISAFMIVFKNVDLKRRNLCAPITLKSMNAQILLGNVVFSFSVFILLIGFSFVLYGQDMLNLNGLFFCANAFSFTLAALSISFLISNLANASSISAVNNVVTLGTCFLSGVFVPQQFLGDGVLTIASFTPTFWFVKANNTIGTIVQFTQETSMQLGGYMLVQIGFAVGVLAVTFFIIKRRRQTKS